MDFTGTIFRVNNLSSQVSYRTYNNLLDGAWHHVVATYSQSAIDVYIDKQLSSGGGVFYGGTIKDSAQLTIGALNSVYANTSSALNGQVDDIAIYNRALTIDEISKLYDSGRSLHDTGFKQRLTGTSSSVR